MFHVIQRCCVSLCLHTSELHASFFPVSFMWFMFQMPYTYPTAKILQPESLFGSTGSMTLGEDWSYHRHQCTGKLKRDPLFGLGGVGPSGVGPKNKVRWRGIDARQAAGTHLLKVSFH